MSVEAVDGFDGLKHLPGGNQFLMVGKHVRASAYQTVAATRQGVPDGRHAQS